MSLLCRMTLGQKRLLFTGDIEKDRIAQLLDSDEELSADWIKTPHHGEYQKIQKKLFKKVAPEYAVISTSHEMAPDEKLTDCLDEYHIRYFTTMDNDVTTTCDGLTINVE